MNCGIAITFTADGMNKVGQFSASYKKQQTAKKNISMLNIDRHEKTTTQKQTCSDPDKADWIKEKTL